MSRSESARMTTAAEARFRIDAPNSQPRNVMVVALDARSETVVKALAQQSWSRAGFFTASAFAAAKPRQDAAFSMQGWLSDLAGRTKDLIDEVAAADLVVMVASAGEDAQAAALIGEACQVHRVMTTTLVLGASDTHGAATLAQLRPWSGMLVAASSQDYIADMLIALRA
jgi:hypothetical protein